MDFNYILNELKIAGEEYNPEAPSTADTAKEKSIKRNQQKKAEAERKANAEMDKNRPISLSAYDKLFKLKVFRTEQGDAFVDAHKATNLATVMKELDDDKLLVGYYDVDVTKLPQKVQNALNQKIQNKIERSGESEEDSNKTIPTKPEINNSEDEYGKNIVSNIQKIMNTLSGESLTDLLDLAKSLKRRDDKSK